MKRQKHKDIVRKTTALIVALLLLTLQLAAAAICYADDFAYKSFREGMFYLAMPKTWQAKEIGNIDEDEEMLKDGELAYQVLKLTDEDGAEQGDLWAYAELYNNSFYYCDTEAEALEYWNECGSDAIDEVFLQAFQEADSWERMEPECVKGEDDFTYVLRQKAKVDGEKYLVYLSCDFTQSGGIHEVLLFRDPKDQNICDAVAESAEAYSYATELIENRCADPDGNIEGEPDDTYYEDNDSGSNAAELAFTVILAALLGFAYLLLRRVIRFRRSGTDRRVFHKTIDKWTLKEERNGTCKHEDMQIRSGAKYSGYAESLKTLHRSGLLTTKEMNELLEKHKNDI